MSNPALKDTWFQIAATFGSHIYNHDNPEKAVKWSILSPPTGSGKTESTVKYAAMLSTRPNDAHPGMLIVTRLIADCDRIAERINEFGIKFGGRETAIAYHSDVARTVKLTDLKQYPVVVITHRAYEMALDFLGHEGRIEKTWPFFHDYPRTIEQNVTWPNGTESRFHEEIEDTRRLVVGEKGSNLDL